MMNPAAMIKLMNAKNTFTRNHPKFEAFIKAVFMRENGIPEGTIIEVTVTKPGGEPVSTNLKVMQSDLDMINELRNLG